MRYPLKIGVVCLARHTFDSQAAADRYAKVQVQLTDMEATSFVFVKGLVVEMEDVQTAAQQLAAANVDGVVCISGTFHLGHLVLHLHRALAKPLLLWAWSELPYDGGKIRLNSLCGLNLDASNLYKAGVRNFHFAVGDRLDTDWLDALRIRACLAQAHLGIAGGRAHGFFNLCVDELAAYRELGTLVDRFELEELWRFEPSETDLIEYKDKIRELFAVDAVTAEQVDQVATLAARLRGFTQREGLSALAIRCWPEFAARYGIAPCAAMSVLQAEGLILACEGDVEGMLSMLAQRAVGGETPYLFDLSQVDFDEDFALLWHCGAAPCNLWDARSSRALDSYFAAGKGVTADFVLKPGKLSVVRFDAARGEQRLFLQQGHGMAMEKELKGTYLKARFDKHVRDVVAELVENGVAHHASMVYGECTAPFKVLAKMQGWRVIGG